MLKKYDALPNCRQREAAFKLAISQTALCNILKQGNKIFDNIACKQNVLFKKKRKGKSNEIECSY